VRANDGIKKTPRFGRGERPKNQPKAFPKGTQIPQSALEGSYAQIHFSTILPIQRYFLGGGKPYFWRMNGQINQPKGWETPKNARLAEALKLGRFGFRVIPLRPGRKEPLIPNWPNEATTDEAKIREWWTRWPNANIGIVTGRYRDGYFIVLDFDPRNGGDWFDDVGEDILPPTWVVHTPSGGRHYYYRTRELLRSAKLPGGVDLKGDGGYVVAPPSILLDENGEVIGEYGWQVGSAPEDMEMGEATSWVYGQLSGKRAGGNGVGGYAAGRVLSLWLMPPPIPKGMRHNYLVSLAGALLAAGLSEREIEAVLWGAIELFETREDFDPVAEIGGILKGLQKWEGETYSLGSLLRRLPERTATVVRRVLSGGIAGGGRGGDGVGVVAGQSRDADARVSQSAQSIAEPSKSAGGDAGQSDGGGSDGNAGRLERDRFHAAQNIVRSFEMRQRGDGTFYYVYRTPDGNELETASCDAKAVKDFLGRLGLNIPLKEVKTLLGLSKETDAGDGEAKPKKKRGGDGVNVEDIKAILGRYKWVIWQGALWQVAKPKLLKADLDRIHGILKQNGLDVGKETLKSHLRDILTDIPKDPLEGIVVTPEPTYGKVGGLRGLWFHHRGDLYLVTPTEIRVFPAGQWPEGVYTLDLGRSAVFPDWDGTIDHLLIYWEGITKRVRGNPRVTLAMFLPVLFGQGHIGLVLRGPARSGKSTLLKALGYLRLGRKPATPSGSANMRDIIAVLHRRQIVFFDEVNTFTPELEEALKRMITHDGSELRELYTDFGSVETELRGSAIFCTTNLEKLASDLRTRCFVWDLAEKGESLSEEEIMTFCQALWPKALGGAIKLYQQAARVKKPPKTLLPQVRFRDWLAEGYRYAQVLGVTDEFVAFVAKSKRTAHRGDKYEFLLDAILHPNFDPSKEYTLGDLLALASVPASEANRIRGAISREGVRSDMIALALDAGYNLRIEKGWAAKERKDRYKFIFSPLEGSTGDYLRELLKKAGVEADWDEDWDGESAPMAEPIPQNDPVPMPEVHTPTPASEKALLELPRSLSEVKKAVQKAPPVGEPMPMAAKGSPAEVGGGAPMAPLTPGEALAIALQSARPFDPSHPTPEKNERGIEVLREALARLPKPWGILQQRGTPIEGAPHVPLPPELTEYLRAMAGTLAAEAVKAAEKGRFEEARAFWSSAVKYLGYLAFFTPTREAIAAVLLARAAERALEAAQDPDLRETAGLFAKAAGAVFLGKAAPSVLLGVLLETPPPTEYDPDLARHYRFAAGYLVAAHWVLTGRDLKLLNGWDLPMRWKRDDAEAMLLFSLGSEKKSVACAHLYLGDLPF
jgi:hypothetical protein